MPIPRMRTWLACLALLVCALCPQAAWAAKMPESFDVTFRCATSDSSVVFSGESFSVYAVADADGDVDDAYAGVAAADEGAYAQALAKVVSGRDAYATFTSDGNGDAHLSLAPGKYLVTGDAAVRGYVTYEPVPFVLDLTDESLLPSLTSYVKYTADDATPDAGRTDATGKTTAPRDKATLQTGVMSLAAVAAVVACVSAMVPIAMVVRARQTDDEE